MFAYNEEPSDIEHEYRLSLLLNEYIGHYELNTI